MPRIIDLTLTIADFMPSHRTIHRPFYRPHLTHPESVALKLGTPEDPMTFASNYFSMSEHTGTHVDAFFHTSPDGPSIDEMDLNLFMGSAVCLDLRHTPDLGDIDVADLEEAERKAGVRIEGQIVLLCTGFHRRHWPNDSVSHNNPGLTAAATHWIADRGSVMHGVEGPSTDKPNDPRFLSHLVCRHRRLAHYEWLVNLEELLGKGVFYFQGIPLKLNRGTGSPVRAFATLD